MDFQCKTAVWFKEINEMPLIVNVGTVFETLMFKPEDFITTARRHWPWVSRQRLVHFFKTLLCISFVTHSIPLACAECDDSLPFSGASSIPLCCVLFLATLHHQLFFHPLSLHLAIYFLVFLSILLFSNSYIILFWEFYFLPFSVLCPNQRNLFNLIVSFLVGFLILA